MKDNLLLVIDMQNAYLPNQPWECANIMEVIPKIQRLCESDKFSEVVFTRFIAETSPVGTWIDYNLKYADINSSTYLNDIIEELKPYVKTSKLVDKSTYSCYKNETIKTLVDSHETVTLCGVVADCCVLSTALDIIDTGKPLVYISDAVGEYKLNSGKAVASIMDNMSLHVTSLTTEDFLNS